MTHLTLKPIWTSSKLYSWVWYRFNRLSAEAWVRIYTNFENETYTKAGVILTRPSHNIHVLAKKKRHIVVDKRTIARTKYRLDNTVCTKTTLRKMISFVYEAALGSHIVATWNETIPTRRVCFCAQYFAPIADEREFDLIRNTKVFRAVTSKGVSQTTLRHASLTLCCF